MSGTTQSAIGLNPCRHPRRFATILGTLVAALLLVSSALQGQQLTGSLSGTTYDQTGAVIPNAVVELKNEASGDHRKTISNSGGYFTITAIPAGSYTLTISAQGFTSWQQQNIVLGQGDNRTLPNIGLKVGGTTQDVEAGMPANY
jgi:hypothetical protein